MIEAVAIFEAATSMGMLALLLMFGRCIGGAIASIGKGSQPSPGQPGNGQPGDSTHPPGTGHPPQPGLQLDILIPPYNGAHVPRGENRFLGVLANRRVDTRRKKFIWFLDNDVNALPNGENYAWRNRFESKKAVIPASVSLGDHILRLRVVDNSQNPIAPDAERRIHVVDRTVTVPFTLNITHPVNDGDTVQRTGNTFVGTSTGGPTGDKLFFWCIDSPNTPLPIPPGRTDTNNYSTTAVDIPSVYRGTHVLYLVVKDITGSRNMGIANRTISIPAGTGGTGTTTRRRAFDPRLALNYLNTLTGCSRETFLVSVSHTSSSFDNMFKYFNTRVFPEFKRINSEARTIIARGGSEDATFDAELQSYINHWDSNNIDRFLTAIQEMSDPFVQGLRREIHIIAAKHGMANIPSDTSYLIPAVNWAPILTDQDYIDLKNNFSTILNTFKYLCIWFHRNSTALRNHGLF